VTNPLDCGGDQINSSPILSQFFTLSQCNGIRQMAAPYCKGNKIEIQMAAERG